MSKEDKFDELDEDLRWLSIYAIYDKKGESFDTPFFARNTLFAKRRYMLMAEENNSPLRMWPHDFELYKIARFNIKTSVVIEDNELVLEGGSIITNRDGGN